MPDPSEFANLKLKTTIVAKWAYTISYSVRLAMKLEIIGLCCMLTPVHEMDQPQNEEKLGQT